MTALRLPRVTFERGRFDSPAGWALVSLAAHVTLAGSVLLFSSLFSSFFSRTREPLPDPGFSVSLASLPPGGGGSERPAPAPRPEPPPKAAEAAPAPPVPVPAERTVPKPARPSEKNPVTKTPSQAPAAPSGPPVGESTGPASAAAGQPGAPPGPGVPGGTGDIRSLTSADFPYASYTLRLINLLRSNWRRPHAPDDVVHTATVAFTIQRDGTLADLRIDVPSDLPLLDISIERAVEDAAPFPPLPAGYDGASLPARIVFELTPE